MSGRRLKPLLSQAELLEDQIQNVLGGGDADNGVQLSETFLEINGQQVTGCFHLYYKGDYKGGHHIKGDTIRIPPFILSAAS